MGKHRRNAVSSDDDDDLPDPKAQRMNEPRETEDEDLDMFLDKEDQEKLNMMSEKDREIEIFKRLEQRAIQKTREEIAKKLEMAQKAEERKAEAGTSRDSAAAARPPRKSTQQKKPAIKDDDEEEEEDDDGSAGSDSSSSSGEANDEEGLFSSSEDDDEGITLKSKEPKSSKAKPAASSRGRGGKTDSANKDEDDSDGPDELSLKYHRPSELASLQSKKAAMDNLMTKRKNKQKAEEKRKQQAALDIDEIFGDDDSKSGSSSSSSSRSSSRASSRSYSPETKPEISERSQLSRIRLSRFKLAQFAHAPFFKKMATGCFVRIGIGQNAGKPVYRVAQIVDVVETAKVYQVEKTRTNKGLKLKHGPDVKMYRLEFVSNSDFTQSEYDHWTKAMRDGNLPLPTMDLVERKEKDISNAVDYKFTNADIDLMVKEKSRFSKAPTNFAFQKGEFLKAKECAEAEGNIQLVQELQLKVDQLDTRADQLDRQRSQKLSVVSWINQRNRDHMKQIFLGGGTTTKEENVVDDPFTRKSGKMKVVSGTAKAGKGAAAAAGALLSEAASKIKPLGLGLAADALNVPKKAVVELPKITDLFSAHDIEIDIQLKLPAAGPSRTPNVDNHQTTTRMTKPVPAAGSRTLTLEEYKRKRGLI